MAEAAVTAGKEHYDYRIRARLYSGLRSGSMKISSLYRDERLKLMENRCCYCGGGEHLSLDHLVPRAKGGEDRGDNLVYACRSCNSSKSDTDFLVWCQSKGRFPPLRVLRRYMKLAYGTLSDIGALDRPYEDLPLFCDIYRLDLLPLRYPAPSELQL